MDSFSKPWIAYSCFKILTDTRSYAALQAADLDWIVWLEYSLGGKEEGVQAGINKNVTHAGSQLTRGGGVGQE